MKRPPNRMAAVKTVYARSGGICAFPGCGAHLVSRETGALLGDICHIHAVSPGGPRYSPDMTADERNGVENLIALCPTHHRLIDATPTEYPASVLLAIRKKHEADMLSRLTQAAPALDERTF